MSLIERLESIVERLEGLEQAHQAELRQEARPPETVYLIRDVLTERLPDGRLKWHANAWPWGPHDIHALDDACPIMSVEEHDAIPPVALA